MTRLPGFAGTEVRRPDSRPDPTRPRSEEHTSELQSPCNLVCRLLLEKKNATIKLPAFVAALNAAAILPAPPLLDSPAVCTKAEITEPGTLETCTVTVDAVAVFPAASRTTAVNVWAPLIAVSVFHWTAHGPAVSSVPKFAPSSLNWTPATATLSDAVAATLRIPDTVVPFEGPQIDTAGGVVSGVLFTVTVTGAEVVELPAASRATALSV